MHPVIEQSLDAIGSVLLGKDRQIRLALTALLCRGHLLIEDLPGMGKTTLAHALARAMGLSYNRIQFTSDLLPGDLIGVNIFNADKRQFEFHAGPLFAQLVLADEINRASPKSQSALLEAMEERQISVEGTTHQLPKPFFVIATQNPADQSGTFPLPESQLDRFFMRVHLGYPPPEAEREILKGYDQKKRLDAVPVLLDEKRLFTLQYAVDQIHVSDVLVDYIQRLLAATRNNKHYGDGLSPRAGRALIAAAKGWALLHGRDHALPDDVKAVLPAVAEHRLGGSSHAEHHPLSEQLLQDVVVHDL